MAKATLKLLIAGTISTLLLFCRPGMAGPPYLTDDPIPTDFRHYEIYAFGAGTLLQGSVGSETGIDFNYGVAPNLQLTLELPFVREPSGLSGLANVGLAAKYLFLSQDDFGLNVAFYPHLILPSASANVGDRQMGIALPFWAQRDFGKWSIFGGGGCTLNRTRLSSDFCEAGLTVTREITDDLKLGMEVFHSGPTEPGAKANTALGVGLTWEMNENYHVLAYWGPNLTHPTANGRSNFYAALLFAL